MAKSNLTTCSGIGKALKTSKSKGVRSAAGKSLATKCKTKGTLFAKQKPAKCSTCALKKKATKAPTLKEKAQLASARIHVRNIKSKGFIRVANPKAIKDKVKRLLGVDLKIIPGNMLILK